MPLSAGRSLISCSAVFPSRQTTLPNRRRSQSYVDAADSSRPISRSISATSARAGGLATGSGEGKLSQSAISASSMRRARISLRTNSARASTAIGWLPKKARNRRSDSIDPEDLADWYRSRIAASIFSAVSPLASMTRDTNWA